MSNPIRIGLVGLGRAGVGMHIAELESRKDKFVIVAVCDEIEAILDEILAEDACLGLKDLAVNGKDLMALGFPAGPQIGKCLQFLLDQVLDEALPNEKHALLNAAGEYLSK